MANDPVDRVTSLDHGLRWSWATIRSSQALLRINHEVSTGQRPRVAANYEDRVSFWELKVEVHLFLVCAQNMARALQAIDCSSGEPLKDLPMPSERLSAHVRALRNALEHWDEPHGRGRTTLESMVGADAANRYGWGPEDALVAGLSLDELATHASQVHTYLRGLEECGWAWTGSPPP